MKEASEIILLIQNTVADLLLDYMAWGLINTI